MDLGPPVQSPSPSEALGPQEHVAVLQQLLDLVGQMQEKNWDLQSQLRDVETIRNTCAMAEQKPSVAFLIKATFISMKHSQEYAMNQTKIGLILSLLIRRILAWASPLLEQDNSILTDWEALQQGFAYQFDDPNWVRTVELVLRRFCQLLDSTTDYATEFQQWAVDAGWNNSVLMHQFWSRLCEEVKNKLAQVDSPSDLDAPICICTQIDNQP